MSHEKTAKTWLNTDPRDSVADKTTIVIVGPTGASRASVYTKHGWWIAIETPLLGGARPEAKMFGEDDKWDPTYRWIEAPE
jgi:hypothetical protein